VSVAERGALGGNEEVAGERELETACHGGTVDRSEDGLRHRPEHGERAAILVVAPANEVRRRAAELAEIQSGAERRVGAGENDHVDAVIRFGVGERKGEGSLQFAAHRVAGVGAVESDSAHTIVGVRQNQLAHEADPSNAWRHEHS
jgi:hypothetical protein